MIRVVVCVLVGLVLSACTTTDGPGLVTAFAQEDDAEPDPKPPKPAKPAPSEALVAPAPTLVVPTSPVTPPSAGYRTEDERNSIDVFRKSAPATVFVTQKRLVVNYWAGTQSEVPAGSGSGFVWDSKGHIVTNFHVIRGAQLLSVTLHDHRSFDAAVVGTDPRKDIAVLRIKKAPADLQPIPVRERAARLEVGQKTIAIGNPFGLDQTLTTGIISALGRQVQGIGGVTIRDMVQTDAAINPGNSGGPLLDSSGYLIGMNTMIFSRSGASAGIGFAVPVHSIKRVVPQIIATGKPTQVGLGVRIDPAQRLEQRLGIRGVLVLDVIPNTPASRAGLVGLQRTDQGLRLGHVIVGINDEKIADYDDLYNTLDRHKPGDRVTVHVEASGQSQKVEMELVEIP